MNALRDLNIALEAANASVETLFACTSLHSWRIRRSHGDDCANICKFLGNSRPSVIGIGIASLVSKATLEAVARLKRFGRNIIFNEQEMIYGRENLDACTLKL